MRHLIIAALITLLTTGCRTTAYTYRYDRIDQELADELNQRAAVSRPNVYLNDGEKLQFDRLTVTPDSIVFDSTQIIGVTKVERFEFFDRGSGEKLGLQTTGFAFGASVGALAGLVIPFKTCIDMYGTGCSPRSVDLLASAGIGAFVFGIAGGLVGSLLGHDAIRYEFSQP